MWHFPALLDCNVLERFPPLVHCRLFWVRALKVCARQHPEVDKFTECIQETPSICEYADVTSPAYRNIHRGGRLKRQFEGNEDALLTYVDSSLFENSDLLEQVVMISKGRGLLAIPQEYQRQSRAGICRGANLPITQITPDSGKTVPSSLIGCKPS